MSIKIAAAAVLVPVAAVVITGRAWGLPWRDIPYIPAALALWLWANSERRKA